MRYSPLPRTLRGKAGKHPIKSPRTPNVKTLEWLKE